MPSPCHAFASLAATRRTGVAAALLLVALSFGGCQSTPEEDYEPVIAEFYVEVPPQVSGATTAQLPRSGVQIVISPRPVLGEADLRNVELVKVDLGLCLLFEFVPDSARDLLRLTAANLGRRLVVTLNGKPFGARLIDGPIQTGQLYMFVELPDDELTETAVNLKRTAHEVQTALAQGKGKKK